MASKDEQFTPPKILDLVRAVLGNIDVDPASCYEAQQSVRADVYYTLADSGLDHEWRGRVWGNPPYSHPLVGQFGEKLTSEIELGHTTEALWLINAGTSTRHFHHLEKHCTALTFPAKRIGFARPGGCIRNSNRYDQAFFYFGLRVGLFADVFTALGGRIWR